jgi:predicted Zn-dependent protease
MRRPDQQFRVFFTFLLILSLVAPAQADRTTLEPGWNIFSPEQDVEIGRQVAQEAERELRLINDRQTAKYINALGKRLASRAPGEEFPYQFKVVNDTAINAFALPGGFIYINRGVIEVSQNEAQLASVVAHEIAHVALRHGTNQMSRAVLTQMPLEILGGVVGSNSIGSVLAQLGISFTANSILLKYSRDAEREADLMGVQILYDSGYDPSGSVQFFQKLQGDSKGRAIEFFRSHPDPENRMEKVQEEIERLGGVPPQGRTDSAAFQRVRASLLSKAEPADSRLASIPSERYVRTDFAGLSLSHPDNWKGYGEGSVVTLAPDGGMVSSSLVHGMLVARHKPEADGNGQTTLEQATDQLITELRRSNPKMSVASERGPIRVGGQPAISVKFDNESPLGFRETNWLVTVLGPDGTMYYFVAVAPESQFNLSRTAFDQVLASVRFR